MNPSGAHSVPTVQDEGAFRAAFHVAQDPSAFVTLDGIVLEANASLEALTLRDGRDLRGRSVDALAAPESRGRLRSVVRSASAWSDAVAEVALALGTGGSILTDAHARLFVTASGERLVYLVARDARPRLRRERMQALALDVSRAGNRAAAPEELGEEVLAALRAAIPEAGALALFAHDEATEALVPIAASGLPESPAPVVSLRDASSLVGHACATRESALVLDARVERIEHATLLPPDATSILAVPVVGGDDLFGGILLGSRGERLSLDDLRAVELAASEVASALQRLESARRLAAAEARYRSLLHGVDYGVLLLDDAGLVREANPSARALLAWDGRAPAPLEEAARGAEAAIRRFLADLRDHGAATAVLDVDAGSRRRHLRAHAARAAAPGEPALVTLEEVAAEVRDRRMRDLASAFGATELAAAAGPFPAAELVQAALDASEAVAAAWIEPAASGHRVIAEARRGDARVPLDDEGVAARLAEALEGGPVGLADLRPASPEAPAHVTVLPAVADGRTLAVVVLAHGAREGAPFAPEDAEWLQIAADKLARLLQHHDSNRLVRAALARERDALDRARRLNDELEEFTLWTTHDLREPLRSLATLAGFLEEDVGHLTAEEEGDIARKIQRSADLLKERVLALHSFSVLARNERRAVWVDLASVMDRVLREVHGIVSERGARVLVQPDMPMVRAQEGRLDLVLRNLVENAVKYGHPGEPVVRVGAERLDGRVRIVVEDNGPGVPDEVREKVFQLFYRSPWHKDAGGSGTGLAIVKRIALQHGGDAAVERSGLGGARFVVTVPSPDPAEAPGS